MLEDVWDRSRAFDAPKGNVLMEGDDYVSNCSSHPNEFTDAWKDQMNLSMFIYSLEKQKN